MIGILEDQAISFCRQMHVENKIMSHLLEEDEVKVGICV